MELLNLNLLYFIQQQNFQQMSGTQLQKQEYISVFSLQKPTPQQTVYYGEDLESNCADVYYAEKPIANYLILLFHGGYWQPKFNREHLRPYAYALAQNGFDTLNVQYRRIPGDPDVYIKDTVSAIEVLPGKLKKTYEKLVLIGHSVGGYLAYFGHLILNKQSIKSILLAPVLNLQRTEDEKICVDVVTKYIGGPASSRKDLDPFQLENYPQGQMTIVQGQFDTLVPCDFTRQYMKKYQKKQTQKWRPKYIQIPKIGHYSIINPKCQEIMKIIINQISI